MMTHTKKVLKTILSLLALVLLSGPAFAQTLADAPPPTLFKGFKLGSSVQEFITQAGIDRGRCVHPKSEAKYVCKQLEAIERGARTGISINMQDGSSIAYKFDRAVLYGIHIERSLSKSSFDEQVRFLSEKYGKPTSRGTETLQNGYGTQWEVGTASWKMPDGAVIRTNETLLSAGVAGMVRYIFVEFTSKDEVAKEVDAKKKIPNPY
jgi:hypothetical protein